MNKTKTVLYLVFGAALVGLMPASSAWGAPAWEAAPEAETYKNPVARTPASIAAGKKVYGKYCVLCHGEKGGGDGPSAKTLGVFPASFQDKSRMDQSDGSLAWKILNGRGPMPSWAPVLAEADIWNVINFIRGFAP